MTSYYARGAAAALWAALLVAGPVQAGAAGPRLQVQSVKVDGRGEGRRVTVSLSAAPSAIRNFALSRPPRVVVDVSGPVGEAPAAETRFPVEDAFVRRVRTAPFEGRLRVVLDLERDVRLGAVTPTADGFVAMLGKPDLSPTPAEAVPPSAAATGTTPVAAATMTPATIAVARAAATPPAAAVSRRVPERPRLMAVAPATDEPESTAPVTAAPAPAASKAPAPVPAAASKTPGPKVAASKTPAPKASASKVPAPVTAAAASKTVVAKTSVQQAAASAVAAPKSKPAPPFHGQRISLDFKDADIQNVLRVLADVSGLNIIATDDVKGKVTLHLTDVPWDQAFDLILRTNRLESTQEGSVVRISSVARLKEEREQLLAADEAAREVEPLRVKYLRVNYARADEQLIDKVRGVLTPRGSVTFDDRTNTVILRDIQRGIQDATRLVSQLDVQSPQVLIEANIVEATEDFSRGLGVQWGYRYEAGPETGNPTGMNFPGTVGIGGSGLGAGTPAPGNGTGVTSSPVPFLADFPVPAAFGSGFGPGTGSALDLALGSLDGVHSLSARLTALEDSGNGRVVSRPRVITMNNVAATIQSLTILRVKLPSTGTVINTGQGGAAGAASTATEKINTGITLVVTPQVSSDGYVLMSIYAKSSQPDFTRAVDGIPNEISREANSNVLVRSGETVVLGGIYRQTVNDTESGLPYLRSIPGLGWLFKRQLKADRKEELLVFLTPKILDTGTASLPPAERLWSSRPKG
jgi:type IV pilus assembly protein PilQ